MARIALLAFIVLWPVLVALLTNWWWEPDWEAAFAIKEVVTMKLPELRP